MNVSYRAITCGLNFLSQGFEDYILKLIYAILSYFRGSSHINLACSKLKSSGVGQASYICRGSAASESIYKHRSWYVLYFGIFEYCASYCVIKNGNPLYGCRIYGLSVAAGFIGFLLRILIGIGFLGGTIGFRRCKLKEFYIRTKSNMIWFTLIIIFISY